MHQLHLILQRLADAGRENDLLAVKELRAIAVKRPQK